MRNSKRSLSFISVLLGLFIFFVFPVSALAAQLIFSPDTVNMTVQDTKTVFLHLRPTGSNVIGVDAVVRFDPNYLSMVTVNNRNVFSALLGMQINNDAGIAKFALTNSYGVFQKTQADIAEIVFSAKKSTPQTQVTLDFTPDESRDTNVAVSQGKDVLTKVGNIIFSITDPNPTVVNNNTTTIVAASSEPTSSGPAASTNPAPSATPAVFGATNTLPPAARKAPIQTVGIISPLPDATPLPSASPEEQKNGSVLGSTNVQFPPQISEGSLLPWLILAGLILAFIAIKIIRTLEKKEEERVPAAI